MTPTAPLIFCFPYTSCFSNCIAHYYIFHVIWILFFGHIVLFTRLHFPHVFPWHLFKTLFRYHSLHKNSLNTIYQLPILEHLVLSLGCCLSFMSICTFSLNCSDSNLEYCKNLSLPFHPHFTCISSDPYHCCWFCLSQRIKLTFRKILNLLNHHLITFFCTHLKFQTHIVNALDILLLSLIVHSSLKFKYLCSFFLPEMIIYVFFTLTIFLEGDMASPAISKNSYFLLWPIQLICHSIYTMHSFWCLLRNRHHNTKGFHNTLKIPRKGQAHVGVQCNGKQIEGQKGWPPDFIVDRGEAGIGVSRKNWRPCCLKISLSIGSQALLTLVV